MICYEVTILCDTPNCPDDACIISDCVHEDVQSAEDEARKMATEEGWALLDDKWFCPKCMNKL